MRVKQAVMIVSDRIERMKYPEDYEFVLGMMEMGLRLDRLTKADWADLNRMLDAKYAEVLEKAE
jgi:hypothetical protein